MKDEHKAIKTVITGKAIPKSVGLIELEGNYCLLADMMAHLIDRVEKIEKHIEILEKRFCLPKRKTIRKSRKKKRK
jgi:hypothetical protein